MICGGSHKVWWILTDKIGRLQTVSTGLTFEGSEIYDKDTWADQTASFSTQMVNVFLFCFLCLSCFACGQIQEVDWDSVGTLPHRGNFLQLVLVAVAERWIWIKICNLKDGGHGDKDRGIWERRGDIIIIRASSFAHKPKLSPHQHPHPHKTPSGP